MSVEFVLQPQSDPVALLKAAIPELMEDSSWGTGPYDRYAQLVEFLLSNREDKLLWNRAGGLFEQLALGGCECETLLVVGVVEAMQADPSALEKLRVNLGPAAQKLLTGLSHRKVEQT